MDSVSGTESLAELEAKVRSASRLKLTKDALLNIVDRFLNGQLTADELQEFGDLLEYDQVDYDDESPSGVVGTVVFEIATPEANAPITREVALQWRALLEPS